MLEHYNKCKNGKCATTPSANEHLHKLHNYLRHTFVSDAPVSGGSFPPQLILFNDPINMINRPQYSQWQGDCVSLGDPANRPLALFRIMSLRFLTPAHVRMGIISPLWKTSAFRVGTNGKNANFRCLVPDNDLMFLYYSHL